LRFLRANLQNQSVCVPYLPNNFLPGSPETIDSFFHPLPACLMTAWWLPDNYLTTAWELYDNSLTTIWELSDNYLRTLWQLPDNCLKAAWQMPDGCLTTVRWLPKDCPTIAIHDTFLITITGCDATPANNWCKTDATILTFLFKP
jgi:hypothetical protein